MTTDQQATDVTRRQLLKLAVATVVATPTLTAADSSRVVVAAAASTAAGREPEFVIENDYPYFGPPPEGHEQV
jgi:hypothetical protein